MIRLGQVTASNGFRGVEAIELIGETTLSAEQIAALQVRVVLANETSGSFKTNLKDVHALRGTIGGKLSVGLGPETMLRNDTIDLRSKAQITPWQPSALQRVLELARLYKATECMLSSSPIRQAAEKLVKKTLEELFPEEDGQLEAHVRNVAETASEILNGVGLHQGQATVTELRPFELSKAERLSELVQLLTNAGLNPARNQTLRSALERLVDQTCGELFEGLPTDKAVDLGACKTQAADPESERSAHQTARPLGAAGEPSMPVSAVRALLAALGLDLHVLDVGGGNPGLAKAA